MGKNWRVVIGGSDVREVTQESLRGKIGMVLRLIPSKIPTLDELNLPEILSDQYFCNMSVFQSMPDSWAIDQLFPIMPLHRHREEPTRQAVLAERKEQIARLQSVWPGAYVWLYALTNDVADTRSALSMAGFPASRYFGTLDHSPDDQVCPYAHADLAEKTLSELGATVERIDYP